MREYNLVSYEVCLDEVLNGLSEREKRITKVGSYTRESAAEAIETLAGMGFVRCPEEEVVMGMDQGLICTIEGHRLNETPPRRIAAPSFYVAKTTVTNAEYERFSPRHLRPGTASGDKHPVTCVTYGRAVSYVMWLNRKTGLNFSLPTEPHQEVGEAIRRSQNVFGSYPEVYPKAEGAATLEVDDSRVPVNYLGLHHMGGNVSVFTLGHFKTTGHWGAASDGAYAVAMGGNFRSCPEGARVVSRGIIDVSAILDIVGIRLVHPDPMLYVED